MNKTIKKFLILFFSLVLFTGKAFSQDAVTKALDLINKNLILNDFDKAYSYAKFVINYYADDEIPEDALTAVNNAVSAKSVDLLENEKWDELLELEDDLQESPKEVQKAALPSIKKAKDHFAKIEKEKEDARLEKERQQLEEKRMIEELKQKEAANSAKAEKDAELQKFIDFYEKQQKLNSQQQLEMEQKRQEAELRQQETMTQMMSQITQNNTEAMKKVSSNNRAIFFGFGFLILIFVLVIIFIVLMVMKQAKANQEQMKNTILTMQAMRVASPISDALPLPLQMGNLALGGPGSSNGQPNLALEDKSDKTDTTPFSEKEELASLLKTCKQYSTQIDLATGRKNVTSRVAELVFHISQNLGYSETDCILFYAAALVYDVGFLSIDSSVLTADTLTTAQFELLQTHTTIGPNMVFFVEEKYRELFKDAAGKHHENLDGSGYPAGLKGNQIPYIAKVLRVVESYVALISSRQYKEISDRNSAIEELKNTPKHYDQEIVAALDAIV